MYPLVACYAVYALIYKTHKSWYSWLLSSLVGAVYSFGFIMMVPQASKAVQPRCSTVRPAKVFAEARLPCWQYLGGRQEVHIFRPATVTACQRQQYSCRQAAVASCTFPIQVLLIIS